MIITSGKYKGRKIKAPDEKITRPTLSKIRESIFSTLFSMIDFEDKCFLDAYAGSGIMGLEALSRGFKTVLAIEKNPKAAQVLKENYINLKLTPNLIVADSLKILPKIKERFDVIYLDPPYLSGIYEQTLEIIKKNSLLQENGIVILEHSQNLDLGGSGFELIKQKKFADKFITFLK